MSVQDPFYLVREEIQDSVLETQTSFAKWERLPDGNSEKIQLSRELHASCDSINWQLDELSQAIDMASGNYGRFGIDEEELQGRRRWTAQCRSQISIIQEKVQKAVAPTLIPAERLPTAPHPKATQSKLQRAVESDNQNFIQNEHHEQEMLMRTQDQQLDDLSATVNRLGAVSLSIGQELDSHGNLLEELDEDMDGVRARLGALQKKMAIVIKKSGIKGQIILIIFLILLLVILVMIAFS
mmetsp:Transcript_13424/g.25802  ORF Transcript_13424/g.25802 Transcript_13424/m.25802 type:complete len:240 (+) Transcript_13424:145-864(+)|eukprot:CAMPEP_0114253338 /NCGR_PEP_ID=MMETSP0058-20121206/16333_1 /TAXON_ID=36894 /ORGANISM="Pyramimonas parkeae, CCMP726" /LENGTH=239 /DNA_ID=CAMNT_0001367365 /DNA_START=130 /DNA_END=849 /DNA_ORIENTATION=+